MPQDADPGAELSLATLTLATGAYAATNIKLFVNGKEMKADIQIKNGNSYAPVRGLAEMLGADVGWDGGERTIMITGKEALSQNQKVVLEPAAQQFADATANPPYLFDLGPKKGRQVVDEVQSGPVEKPDVDWSRLGVWQRAYA